MEEFIRGAIALGYGLAGLFFFRFWTNSRDRLFGLFALAFVVLAVNRVAISLVSQRAAGEVSTYLYLVRLLAFLLILYAIIDKNTRKR